MNIRQALSQDPEVVSGAIVFAGTRVPVWMLFDHIRHGHSLEEFFRGYPGVRPEQVDAVLASSLETIQAEFAKSKAA